MRPLAALTAADVAGLRGVVFDLDDTVLDRGALTEAAFRALFRLREVGLSLVACTGRPAGWGEVIQRQWPLAATVVENGALAFVTAAAGRVVASSASGGAASVRRAELVALAQRLCELHSEVALADDNDARRTDVTLDVGEHRHAPPAVVAALRAACVGAGVRTVVSSVHMHLSFGGFDKASGTLRVLAEHMGEDVAAARGAWAFVGDSGNDAAAFAAFRTTFAVANVAAHLGALTVPPRFVAGATMGEGFAQIAARICACRREIV